MDIGRTNIFKHEIITGNNSPVATQAYRSNPIKKQFIEREIEDMEMRGIIRKSKSPWASPVVVVDKKDSTKRFCVDYRKLNKITKIDRYPLPRIDELLETFRTASWFTTLDLASGYWQVEMNEEDKEKTAFITHKGLYEFNVMPFGLCNAPGTFQRLMNYVLQDFLGKFVAVYLDDIIIYSRTFEQHIDHIRQIFGALRKATLKIKIKKAYFCFPNIAFLGHIVGRNGISPDPAKVEKIRNFPEPTNLKELRGALGLFSYYRKFVKDFSKIAKPMLTLLKKDTPFLWTNKQQRAFDYLKKRLMEAPILQYPDFTRPFVLYTDASGTGLGAVLSQIDDEKRERVIAYASRSLNQAECNYGITDQECLAVVWAIKHFEQYLGLLPFKVITDHSALKFLQTADVPTGKRARWMMYLQQFQFEIVHRPGKENANADALSRIPDNPFDGVENKGGEAGTSANRKFQKPKPREPEEIHIFFADLSNEAQFRALMRSTSETEASEIDQRPDVSVEQDEWGKPDPASENLWQNHEYYSQDEGWGLNYPGSESEVDSDDDEYIKISEVFPPHFIGLSDPNAQSTGYRYTRQELERLYAQNIRIRQVIAGQPYNRGNGQCTFACDTENHHVHTYCCVGCKRNLLYGTTIHHCTLPTRGEPRFVMNPTFLVNNPWWTEPLLVRLHNNYIYLRFLQRMLLGLPFYTSEPTIAELD